MQYTVQDSVQLGFQHAVTMTAMLDFHAVRQWMTQAYGHAENVQQLDPQSESNCWSWELVYRYYVIHLRSDSELSWFRLKFGT
jgi:hypothetical protein